MRDPFKNYDSLKIEDLETKLKEVRHNIANLYSLAPPLPKRMPASLKKAIRLEAKEGHAVMGILKHFGKNEEARKAEAIKQEARRVKNAEEMRQLEIRRKQARYERMMRERAELMDAVAI